MMTRTLAFIVFLVALGISSNVQSRERGHKKIKNANYSQTTSRECLDPATRGVLNNLEARFGKVKIVKSCVPGARMPSGHVSWHARNKAFDFKVPKGVDQRDVMVWLTKNSPGVTISYRGKLAGIIHTDTGSFHKVIYAAADHEAGHRAVAIWQERERLAALPPKPEPPKPVLPAPTTQPWTMTASLDPNMDFSESVEPTKPLSIFERFLQSMSIKVQPQVRLKCSDGSPMPEKLTLLALDAATEFGRTVEVNSAWRPRWYNARIRGAAQNSEHIKCTRTRGAIDFRVVGIPAPRVIAWVKSNRTKYDVGAIGYYGARGHIHVDTRFADLPRKYATKLVLWGYGKKKRPTMYAKKRHYQRVVTAG